MILSMQKIPVTENSWPFISAVKPCELEKHGYVEEEFFQTGTANIYDEGPDGKLEVTVPDAPYTTRLLVRRPEAWIVKRGDGSWNFRDLMEEESEPRARTKGRSRDKGAGKDRINGKKAAKKADM